MNTALLSASVRRFRAEKLTSLSCSVAGILLGLALLPATARAGLLWDLRAVSVTGGGTVVNPKAVTLDETAGPGTIITMELWAVVTGIDGIANEKFQSGIGTILSSPGTLANRDTGVAGNLALANLPTANLIKGNLQNALLSVWLSGPSDNGPIIDLDADGDLDVGGNSTTNTSSYLVVRAASSQDGTGLSPHDFNTLSDGREFKISVATFTVESITGEDVIGINFVVPAFTAALNERARALCLIDGLTDFLHASGVDSNLSVAPPVLVQTVPEPSCATLLVAGAAIFGVRRSRRG